MTDSRGSSPRVRGRRFSCLQMLHTLGLIPAGAGQTAVGAQWCRRAGAHPRGCGADRAQRILYSPSRGSSPRVRGRRRRGEVRHERPGLIPAGAGQTGC